MRSVIKYFGGKGLMIDKLLNLIPDHLTYVEVFGGAASLLFAKKPSKIEVYNDIDSDVVNLFRVLRNEEDFKEFQKLANLTPYSRENFYYCRDTLLSTTNKIERAYKFFVVMRQSFSGTGENWGFDVKSYRGVLPTNVLSYLSAVKRLPEIADRILRVQIEHDDFRKIISRYDTERTFFYLDPPYLPDTRRDGGYKHEMTIEDHKDLLKLITNIKGKVLLSGYDNELYQNYLKNWHKIDFRVSTSVPLRKKEEKEENNFEENFRIETVWMNYEMDENLFNQV